MKNLKENKGVTLIALVITIIVLLILAGVTLSMIMGDSGIFGKANTAKEETKKSQALEDVRLLILEAQADKAAKSENATLADVLDQMRKSSNTYIVKEGDVATLSPEGIQSISDGTKEILVTNIEYGVEVKIDKNLKAELTGTSSVTPTEPKVQTYTVTYDVNYEGGTNPDSTTAEAGASITMPIPERTNYAFTGWYTESTGGTKVEYTTMTAENKTVYAGWAAEIASTSMVGKYADINGDGTVDGVIVIDLLNPPGTKSGSYYTGNWNPSGNSSYTSNGAYSITSTSSSGLKKYYVSKTENADSHFGNKEVITSATGTSGNDRFYVLGLSNITDGTNSTLYWYYNAYGNMSDYARATSVYFGNGKTNTDAMVGRYGKQPWNGGYSTEQNDRDMWKNVSAQSSNGWFVPSRAEWAAIGAALGVNSSNYSSSFGLGAYMWSSSQSDKNNAWVMRNNTGIMTNLAVNSEYYVRMAKTF